jgi:glycosyltransferase involved in cell wall biosynthesis
MKIAFIGTYPPRECGIATFTQTLFKAVMYNNGNEATHEAYVVALNDGEEVYKYPEEVQLTIRQEQQADYIKAAKYITLSGADVCMLEHEFGIFGGQSGVYILPLLHRLEIPLIITMHTVLKTPSYNERAIVREMGKMAAGIIVMTQMAVDFLVDIYEIPAGKIRLIPHGVPELRFDHLRSKKDFKLEAKNVLLTFGFISRNKGIETVLRALPTVIKKYPETLYIVLGKTHPAVLKHSGEEYRVFLMKLVKTLQLEKHVLFLNEFIHQDDLLKYLSASDIYITPYLNEAQITSGTLSYAVGAGSGVLSTPYWHAAELLTNGRGRLFGFNDPEDLTRQLLDLMDHPEKLEQMRACALAYAEEIRWPKIAAKKVAYAGELLEQKLNQPEKIDAILDPLILPPFLLDHVKRMTDDTGIIQHAKYGIPNLKEGYCLDDNARALLMVLMAHKQLKLPQALDLLPVYLSYIHYMQNADGRFRNFLSFNRNFLDEVGSEDSFGRAVWALGYLLGNAPNDAYYQSSKEIFFEAAANFEQLTSIRSIANSIIGLCYYLQTNPGDEGMAERLNLLAYKIIGEYQKHRTDDWQWFEPVMTYDNAILPLALLHAAGFTKNAQIKGIAIESMEFLSSKTLKDGYLSVIGNANWYVKGGVASIFAQQPLDVQAMVLMFHQAFLLTNDKIYLTRLHTSFMWFLGDNDLRMNLYDFETKGCCDGLEVYGVNRNQGAESTLAYLISHLTVLEAFGEVYKIEAA